LSAASERFLKAGDWLGRALCLVLQGWVEQAGGSPAFARELMRTARADFDAIGYRLGMAQCHLTPAHAQPPEGNSAPPPPRPPPPPPGLPPPRQPPGGRRLRAPPGHDRHRLRLSLRRRRARPLRRQDLRPPRRPLGRGRGPPAPRPGLARSRRRRR